MTIYDVITSDTIEEFIIAVNSALSDGWTLQGGAFPYGGKFYQSVTKIV